MKQAWRVTGEKVIKGLIEGDIAEKITKLH